MIRRCVCCSGRPLKASIAGQNLKNVALGCVEAEALGLGNLDQVQSDPAILSFSNLAEAQKESREVEDRHRGPRRIWCFLSCRSGCFVGVACFVGGCLSE